MSDTFNYLGVLGERMLGGGDKGASGALVLSGSVDKLKEAVENQYPKNQSDYADKFAVHICKSVDGVKVFKNPDLSKKGTGHL